MKTVRANTIRKSDSLAVWKERYLKVSKARIGDALTEAGKPPAVEAAKLKKAELAAFAKKELCSSGWLPEPVRISGVADEEAGFGSQ